MRNRVVGAVLLGSVTLGGCTAARDVSPSESPAPDHAEALWTHRTAYVGDNSKVLELVEETGFGFMGAKTVALQTEAAPYGVTISYSSVEKPFDMIDFSSNATLLLGLVGNLDRVNITSGPSSYTFSRSDATQHLGFDVKALGQDEDKLRDYLESLED